MTFAEFHLLKEAYFRKLEQEQRPQAILLWRLWNYIRAENSQPTTLEELREMLGYLPVTPTPDVQVPPPQSAEELTRRLGIMQMLHNVAHGAGRNGDG